MKFFEFLRVSIAFPVGVAVGWILWRVYVADNTLDIIKTIAAVIASGSVFFAFLKYLSDKEQNRNLSVIDQVSFFRKEIISAADDLTRYIRDKRGQDYVFPKIKLDEPTIRFTKEKYLDQSMGQANLISSDNQVLRKQVLILDMMEEFALKVSTFRTEDHVALNCVKAPFVELVEIYAVALLMHKEILSDPSTFSITLRLYSKWKDLVDRRTPEQRRVDINDKLKLLNK